MQRHSIKALPIISTDSDNGVYIMNNEEKILSMLERMQGDISGLKDDVSGLKDDVSGLKDGQARLEARMDRMENRMDRMESRMDKLETGQGQLRKHVSDLEQALVPAALKLENEVCPKLDFVIESQSALLDHLLPQRVEKLENDVSTQKAIVEVLADEVKKSRKAL